MQLVSDAMQVQVLLFHWMSCVAVLFMQGLPANVHHDKHKNCCDMSAGKQAEVLNILLEDLLEGHAVSETKLKEVLGHTPIQVLTLVCSLHVAPVSFPYEFKAVIASLLVNGARRFTLQPFRISECLQVGVGALLGLLVGLFFPIPPVISVV